jgi:hypothetical protein
MELESDLAKELFDKVIIPIQNKNKTAITTMIFPNNTVSNIETPIPVSMTPINKDETKSILELEQSTTRPDIPPPVPDTSEQTDFDKLLSSFAESITTHADSLPPAPINKDETKTILEQEQSTTRPDIPPPVSDTSEQKDFDKLLSSFAESITTPADSLSPAPGNTDNIIPPKPPCRASERDIDVIIDCNPDTKTPTRQALLRFHPDKNKDCQENATDKFKDLVNKCEKYIPPSTESSRPTTSTESSTPTPSDESSPPTPSTESSTPTPSTELSTDIVSTTEPSKDIVSTTEPSKDIVSTTEPSKDIVSTTEPSTDIVPTTESSTKLQKGNVIRPLIQVLLNVLRKPKVSTVKSTEPSDEPILQNDKVMQEPISSCDINGDCQDQPLNQLVKVLSNTLSITPPAAGDDDTRLDEESGEVKSRFNLPKMPTIDISGKLNWITQSLVALFATIGGLFTFEPVQDRDPYELIDEKKNEGYIYVGKMYMKPEDANKKPDSVKYISYNPKNKDFFIDERKEV